VIGGLTVNCGSVGVKFANAPNGCNAIGHTARNCGMMGFMLMGHPFVSRPAKMQYGALCEARYSAPPGAPNTIESFQSLGHTKASAKGFHAEL
jgi:hypothetical protein